MKSKCDDCLKLKEANKLKIPEIIIPADLEKDEVRWCRKCYLDELIRTQRQAESFKLFIACKFKGTFANCKPECCIQCHEDAPIHNYKEHADCNE